MRIVLLQTGLFPDADTVAAAVAELAAGNEVATFEMPPADAGDDAWDEVAAAILAADRIVPT